MVIKKNKKKKNILEIADELTGGDRQKDYGHPKDNFRRIAFLWGGYTDNHYTVEEVGMMMLLVKVARNRNEPKTDNLVDIAGYARCIEMLGEE